MLLNKMCGRCLSAAISLCTAVTFAHWYFNAQADEPEMIHGDSAVAATDQAGPQKRHAATAIMAGIQPLPEGVSAESRADLQSQLQPSGYTPVCHDN